MLGFGKISARLRLAIGLTAMIPLIVAVMLAEVMVRQTSARFFVPEIGEKLDQSLGLYQELARAVKRAMRAEAGAIAAHEPLRRAAARRDRAAVERELRLIFPQYRDLVSLTVRDDSGEVVARVDRGRPVDERLENELEVLRPLSSALPVLEDKDPGLTPRTGQADQEETDEGSYEDGAVLEAVFVARRERFDQFEEMSKFVDLYRTVEQRRRSDDAAYVYAFAVLLGLTMLAAVGVGGFAARGVAAPIRRLHRATKQVAAGDLAIRVPENGPTEIAALASAFNRMLGEVEASRARIEYLQRIAAWQEMARRLAHEIKNPLTPIQLAVQELHRRYDGGDDQYRRLVDTSLEIVEDEVGTLRRLVTEFSDFARLPKASLQEADLADFLRQQAGRLATDEDGTTLLAEATDLEVELEVGDGPAPVYLDALILRRAFINLVRNARQAVHDEGRERGRIRVTLEDGGEYWRVLVDDNGPGIPADRREAIFDPYVTTRAEGTGLGLAITKKIVVDHGGMIAAETSPLGGARFSLRLPKAGTAPAQAALQSSGWEASAAEGHA